MRFHTSLKPRQCNFCEKTFQSRGGLYTHIKKFHSIKQEKITKENMTPFECDECQEVFQGMINLTALSPS